MRSFSVSLDVLSADLTLEELTAKLGLKPSPDAHGLGSPRGRGATWQVTVWRLSSEEPESASLEEHCGSVLARAGSAGVLQAASALENVQAVLNVGVFFYTASCTVTFPDFCLRTVCEHRVRLEVSCYPVAE